MSPVHSLSAPSFRTQRRRASPTTAGLFPECPDVIGPMQVVHDLMTGGGKSADAPVADQLTGDRNTVGRGSDSNQTTADCPPASRTQRGTQNRERGPVRNDAAAPTERAHARLVGIARLAAFSPPAETRRKSEERPEYFVLPVKSILNRCDSKRVPFEWTINPSAKGGILFGALFLVSVLLAAIPGHRAPAVPLQDAQQSSGSQSQEPPPMDHSKMSGMDMDDARANEAHAVHDMTPGHMDAHNLHMHMTAMRPQTSEDAARASEIVTQLRSGIEKYKDYHVALNDGYKIFLPNLPQHDYHFTNYWNGFLEAFTFDPARPTSLLYRKTSDGYELVGAMYTMPKPATPRMGASSRSSLAGWSTSIRTKTRSAKSSPCTTTWTNKAPARPPVRTFTIRTRWRPLR